MSQLTLRRVQDFWLGQTDLRPLGLFRILLGLQLFIAIVLFLTGNPPSLVSVIPEDVSS